jgi:peptidoglycan hydrolase-like protein with peptidoglycan-binding domain
MTIGSTGNDVKALQVFLNTKGFTIAATGPGSKGYETSYFGPATARALGLFQASLGITPPAGYFGPTTMRRVNSLLGQTLPAGSQASSCPTTVTPAVVTTTTGFTRDLQLGSTGSDVKALQQYLNSKGFNVAAIGPGSKGNETAYFGPATQRSLASFQLSVGLPSTGYFGPKSRGIIK